MENIRVYYRSHNANESIKEYKGYAPQILTNEYANILCEMQSGKNITDTSILNYLESHSLIVKESSKYFSTVPMLSVDLSIKIEDLLIKALGNINYSGINEVKGIAKKLGEKWDNVAYTLLSELILGNLWFYQNSRLNKSINKSTVILIPDVSLSHMLYNGIKPLSGNTAISYWQSTLLCNPDTVYDIITNKNVEKSLKSLNDEMEFLVYGNSLVQLKKLRIYKNKTGENNMPVSYIDMPQIDFEAVSLVKSELKEFSLIFNNVYPMLNKVTKEVYSTRTESQKHISEFSLNQVVYLVFSYLVAKKWIDSSLLPDMVIVKGQKKSSNSPIFELN